MQDHQFARGTGHSLSEIIDLPVPFHNGDVHWPGFDPITAALGST
jgi:hypothetical protein